MNRAKPLLLKPIENPFDVRLTLPGSKSFANRALVCAALSQGKCQILNISPGDDTALMLNVLADLGWSVSGRGAKVELTPATTRRAVGVTTLFTGAAGTATRFACALATVTPGKFILDANARMRERPMGDLIAALRQLGANLREKGKPGCVPMEIDGASLRGGTCVLSGEVSSQFLSALLMVAPMVGGGVEIEVRGELVSKPYVDVTLTVMRSFGLPDSCIKRRGYGKFIIKPGSYTPQRYDCPPDATAASYFWAAAAITGSTCVIDGLTRQDAQGDVKFVEVLNGMGCKVLEFPNGLGVRGSVATLRAVEADMSAMPDCAQTLAVVCAFAEGTSRLTGLSTLRVKETDRIAALQAELKKLGVTTRAGSDWMEVDGRHDAYLAPTKRPRVIQTYEDHRMAMSFAVAGLRVPLRIERPEVVSKSFPSFWEYWERLAR